MSFINLKVVFNDEVNSYTRNFDKLLDKFVSRLFCVYVRNLVMMCWIVSRVPPDVHIGKSFLVVFIYRGHFFGGGHGKFERGLF